MRLLYVTHPTSALHDAGSLHPERPGRLRAVTAGVDDSEVAFESVEAVPAEPWDLHVIHEPAYVAAIERLCLAGGGSIDADTVLSRHSYEAALAAAGAGVTAAGRLVAGFDGPALVSVRPPGHHAVRDRAMGFCVFNNVALTAARLRDQGEKVAIFDWDVHHGNGTQEMFYADPDVLYISLHQHPFYPFEGIASEVGRGSGRGYTINVPLPAFTAGDVYLEATQRFVVPALAGFGPDWILVSAGFDAHALDPLAELRLVEADFASLASTLLGQVDPSRIILFLEGGYHLPAIRDSVSATLRALAGGEADDETSPHSSPDEARRTLERLDSALTGHVVGLG